MKLSSALLLLAAVTSAVARTEVCCTFEFDGSDEEYEALFGEAVALNLITPDEAPYNFVTGCFAKQQVCSAPTHDYICDVVVLVDQFAFNCNPN
ncbi:hypothetical protein K438DRAFT_1992642 [Mycena galopus ATCC 62051]|nr:hypothetical protein K438DRAFT_1992642 [Mycena galopus ATCC 62051]